MKISATALLALLPFSVQPQLADSFLVRNNKPYSPLPYLQPPVTTIPAGTTTTRGGQKNRFNSHLKFKNIYYYDGFSNSTDPFEIPLQQSSFIVQMPLDYDHMIKNKIDVSRPYYALQNEHVLKDKKTNEVKGVICDVIPEMPHGREGGVLTLAEAGRHMAIAGSIASAMVQPKEGKFYYLALDAKMSRKSFTGIASASVADEDGYRTKLSPHKHASIFAKCVDMGASPKSRHCSSEITLEISPDEDAWFLEVTYYMIPANTFRKMYGETDAETISRMKNSESPYTTFHGLPNAVQIIYGNSRTDTSISCHTNLPPPRPEDCLGHFEKTPALPIAYSNSFFCDLMAQAISELSGVPITFKVRDEKAEDNNIAFIISKGVQIKAEELVFANSYGQRVECDVELLSGHVGGEALYVPANYDGAMFKANIRAIKEDGSGEIVFKGEYIWQMVAK